MICFYNSKYSFNCLFHTQQKELSNKIKYYQSKCNQILSRDKYFHIALKKIHHFYYLTNYQHFVLI